MKGGTSQIVAPRRTASRMGMKKECVTWHSNRIYLSIKSETTPSKPLNKNWSGGHFVLWLERVNDYSTHNCCSRQSL